MSTGMTIQKENWHSLKERATLRALNISVLNKDLSNILCLVYLCDGDNRQLLPDKKFAQYL